jgi:hypothetical protein
MRRVGLLAVVAALACVPAASAAGKADTRVTLDFIQPTFDGTVWSGDIFSSKKSCKNKRRVLVYRDLAGDDDKRGSTRSYKGTDQPGYFWLYTEPGIPPVGDYYAKVRPTDDCNGDRSPLFTFTGP